MVRMAGKKEKKVSLQKEKATERRKIPKLQWNRSKKERKKEERKKRKGRGEGVTVLFFLRRNRETGIMKEK